MRSIRANLLVGKPSLLAAALALLALLAACNRGAAAWHAFDVSGTAPPLSFAMTRASDGKEIGAADYRGKIVLLYFGYTYCPDVCPTTLMNVSQILQQLGPGANDVRLLFVTVDPNRDTLPILADYARHFAPEIDGLRGNEDQLIALARRYRVIYSVKPAANGRPYEVSHSSALYAFDRTGAARLLVSPLTSSDARTDGVVADLRRLVAEPARESVLDRVARLF